MIDLDTIPAAVNTATMASVMKRWRSANETIRAIIDASLPFRRAVDTAGPAELCALQAVAGPGPAGRGALLNQ